MRFDSDWIAERLKMSQVFDEVKVTVSNVTESPHLYVRGYVDGREMIVSEAAELEGPGATDLWVGFYEEDSGDTVAVHTVQTARQAVGLAVALVSNPDAQPEDFPAETLEQSIRFAAQEIEDGEVSIGDALRRNFPTAKSGDVDPLSQFALGKALERFVRDWSMNDPRWEAQAGADT